jgi:hypothetical protein
MVIAAVSPPSGDNKRPEGHCSRCRRVWSLETEQGVCQWCGKPATCQTTRTTALRSLKSSSRRAERQTRPAGSGYEQLSGQWLTYYNVALRHASKVMPQDCEDVLHDIILTLARVERNNGHDPFTEGTMHRIASRCVYHYWYDHYRIHNGLDCKHCSKAQRAKCKEDWSYRECSKAIKLERLEKPILDNEGNLTELGELIADPASLDLDAWDRDTAWQIGYRRRLVAIALKLDRGEALSKTDRQYLWRLRRSEQKVLLSM